MNFDLKTLKEVQPEGWPRWASGVTPNRLPDGRTHLFLLEPLRGIPYPEAGKKVALCQFAPGAEFVEAGKDRQPPIHDACDLCSALVVSFMTQAANAAP